MRPLSQSNDAAADRALAFSERELDPPARRGS
jgi:hypothetical protein